MLYFLTEKNAQILLLQWARKMGLKRVGEVQMHRPFEDDPIYAPTSVDTEDEFEDWVEKHKEPVMQKLTRENYYNVWVRIFPYIQILLSQTDV